MNVLLTWCRPILLCLTVALVTPVFAGDTALNDNARLLAGMSVAGDGPLEPLAREKVLAHHSAAFNKAWSSLESGQLSRVRSWSAQNVKDTHPVLFYMFSGPDFLYANLLFPKAKTYVMAGLELPGDIPDLTKLPKSALAPELAALRGSLNSAFSYSFFITNEMKRRLYGRRLTGTLPVLFVFLARSGKTIESVSYVGLDKDGALTPSDAAAQAEKKAEPVGVKITFVGDDKEPRTLYYFRTDLSDDGAESSGFLKFCETLGAGASLIKSASYLPHSAHFSHVRSFLLNQSAMIVQDDTGIPLRDFDAKDWTVEPFGKYERPISLFRRNYQPDLRSFYVRQRPRPLHFSFGYQWRRGNSMMLLAMKKPAAPYVEREPTLQPAKLNEASAR